MGPRLVSHPMPERILLSLFLLAPSAFSQERFADPSASAVAHYRSGRYRLAAADARRALGVDRNDAVAWTTLRLAESRLETQPSPEKTAEAPPELSPADYAQLAFNKRSGARVDLEDPWGSVLETSKAIAANDKDAQAYGLRALAYCAAGEWEKAVLDAERALDLEPTNSLALDARAEAMLELGRYRDALNDSTRSIRLQAADGSAYAVRARTHEKLGNLPAMFSDYQRAVSLDPRFDAAYRRAIEKHALPRENSMEPAPAAAAPARGRDWVQLAAATLLALGAVLLWVLDCARRGAPAGVETIGHFQLLRTIGRGGMGIVYEALDTSMGRRVAIKRMRDEIRLDAKERERFLQEARLVGSLRHPSIVSIHAVLEHARELCLVFEFVEGRTLEEILAKDGALGAAQTLHVMRGVCDALDFAHQRHIVHRDLKPSNIMWGLGGEIKVMDFGIARRAKEAAEKAGITQTIVGTPFYMAPEAELGIVRKESDLYSLGACLYEMLTGDRPFAAPVTSSAKLAMDFTRPSRRRRGLPSAIDALIDGALQPDPDRRISSASEFLAKLESAFSGAFDI